MDLTHPTLSGSALFKNMNLQDLRAISKSYHFTTRRYTRSQVVALEEDTCEAIGIVTTGSIHIQRIFPSGKLITIETFAAGDSFGEALVFSDQNSYPATLIAREETTVLYISRADVVQFCSAYPRFLENFMRSLSNRILLLNSRIKTLSYATLRQKVATYILEERRRQGADTLRLACSRSELADRLGIPRPSLSRELIAMRDEGWIAFDRRTIALLNREAIEQALHH